MNGVETYVGIGMPDARMRNPTFDELPVTLPSKSSALTSPSQNTQPSPLNLSPKAIQAIPISGYCVIVEVALKHAFQPSSRLHRRAVHTLHQCFLDRVHLGDQALADRFAHDDKPTGHPSLPADMRESKEVERLRFALAPLLPILSGKAPELHQARFLRM